MPADFKCASQPGQPIRIVERVELVRGDQHRLVGEPFAGGVAAGEERELARDDVEILDGIAAARRREVDEVHQHLGALEVAQEAMAEAVARMRAFDQPGTSATTNDRSSERPTTPRFGIRVVNG